jgi:hypothetical protein
MKRISEIFNMNFREEKPWNDRSTNGHRVKLINNIRNILNIFSGNQLLLLIKDLIKPNEMKFVATKYYDALQRLSFPINSVKQKNKHIFFRQFKLSNFTLGELNEMDYNIGEKLWSSCKRSHLRLNGGRPQTNSITKESIKSTLEKFSSFSSYRTVLVRKRKIGHNVCIFEPKSKIKKIAEKIQTEVSTETVKNRFVTLQEAKTAYDNSILANENENMKKVSLSTFKKIIKEEKVYKRPQNVIF